ncbi:MAG TPA: flagellar basal-body MS-ring/collar protein FliF [Bacilli bacterium]|nr:flagellar basal-body MS-ring/collar protein FliF [Bacilli bacterium]
MNQFKQLFEKLLGYWKNLEQRQRRNLILVSVFFLLTVTLLSWFAFRPNYTTIFSDQTPASLGEMEAKLEELKIPVQVDSTSISVPEQYVNEARMKLAMSGLPSAGAPGYAVFDDTGLGLTDKEFDVKNKQAIEGNIQNAIQTINGVSRASVNIVLPEQKFFVQQPTSEAKAAIMLKLQPGTKLSEEQIYGIQQLVAASVKGLTPDKVTITDQTGVRLVDENGEAIALGGDAHLTKQQEIQMSVEKEATTKIRNALERLVGLGNVDVIVNAKIDFDQKNWKETNYEPVINGDGAIISSQETSHEATGKSGTPEPTGEDGNDGNTAYPAGSNGESTVSDSSKTENKVWNTTEVNGQTSTYKVDSYTVSVLLNSSKISKTEDELTSFKDDMKAFVSTAIGRSNDGTADDVITIATAPFQAPGNPFDEASFYEQPWFFGAAAAALVLLGGGAYAMSRRRRVVDVPVLDPPRIPDVSTVIEETEQQRMKKQLEKLVSKNPDEFVNLLRTWLVEE